MKPDALSWYNSQSNRFTLGSNINFNKKNTLLLSFSANPSKGSDADETTSQYFNTNKNPAYSVFTDNIENALENATDFIAGYRKTFEKIGEEITVDFTFNSANGNQNQPETFVYPDETRKIKMLTDFSNYNSNLQVNWVLPINENSKLESGVQSIVRGSTNNFSYYNFQNENWNEDVSQKDIFTYNEQIHSLYGIWSAKFDKLSLMAGARLEQTFINGEQTAYNHKIDQKYFNIYPSFSLMREAGIDASFVLSYSRRVNRPTARMINPFENISNPEIIRSGNPDLKPEYANTFELGYSKSWDKTTLGASVFYSYVNDVINQLNILDSVGISHMYPINADNAQSYGFEASFDQIIAKWWKINGSASFFRNNVQSVSSSVKNTSYSYNGRINSSWTPAKGFSVQLTGYYLKPAVGLFTRVNPQTSFDLALKKDLGEKFSMTLRATDIFNQLKNSYTSWGDNFTTDNWRKSETRVIYLSLAYKFGGGEILKSLKPKREEQSKPTLEMF